MVTPREICLDMDGRQLSVQVRRETRERSLHTGRDLAELHGVVTTSEAGTHEWLSETLPELTERSISACDAAGERAGRWIVSWNAYTVNAGVHTYTLILREAEDLSLDVLLLDGEELYPYEYRERIIGDGITIWAKLTGVEEDLVRLRRLVLGRGSFPVVRRGISDEPRAMRLGLAEWSHFEDQIKYRLVLMDAWLPEGGGMELTRVEEENSRAALAYYANLVERLTAHLTRKGLLSEGELAEMRAAAVAQPGVSRHDFWRVPDVDAL